MKQELVVRKVVAREVLVEYKAREGDVRSWHSEEWEDLVTNTLRDLNDELWNEMRIMEALLESTSGALCECGVQFYDLVTLCPSGIVGVGHMWGGRSMTREWAPRLL